MTDQKFETQMETDPQITADYGFTEEKTVQTGHFALPNCFPEIYAEGEYEVSIYPHGVLPSLRIVKIMARIQDVKNDKAWSFGLEFYNEYRQLADLIAEFKVIITPFEIIFQKNVNHTNQNE